MQSRLILWAQRSVAALCLCSGTALAADTPSVPVPVEGDHVIRDFHFASGEVLPELKIHYRTIGTPKPDSSGVVRNAVLIGHGTGGAGTPLMPWPSLKLGGAAGLLLVLAVIWAVVQFPMIGTVSFTTLLICRIILGAGEGPAASVAVHALYKWFPDEKRTIPTAILSQGSAFGVILAVPSLNWIIVNHSWHWAFGALGFVGLLWIAAWLMWGEEGPLTDQVTASAPSYTSPSQS